jgi:hypothetical protein
MSKIIFGIVGIAIIAVVIWQLTKQSSTGEYDQPVSTTVQSGEFDIYVNATGELKAKNSQKIKGPQGMRAAGVYQTNITDLIPEGTVVKEGQYVAALDRTEVENKMRDLQSEIDKITTQLEQAEIDTAIELRGLRDQIKNLEFTRQEKELVVEQSKFEPQMIIRQAELDLERNTRDLEQTKENYRLKQIQATAKISEILTTLRQNQAKYGQLMELSGEFRITAPQDGMVIYSRDWGGEAKGVGSQISAWDPTVAELPDLTDMISISYVNEVDISKVRKGQEVEISIDAFPDRIYDGQVIKVANIGQQMRNQDAKVFEVVVKVYGTDSLLRPAMTTSNKIKTYTFEDVVYVPLEAINVDSLSYVVKKTPGGDVKQEVITGETNDDQIIVHHGLEPGEEIYLQYQKDSKDLEWSLVDPKIKEEIKRKAKEEREKRLAEAREREKSVKDENIRSMEEGGGRRIFIMN